MSNRPILPRRSLLLTLLVVSLAGWVSASSGPVGTTAEKANGTPKAPRSALSCGDLPRLMATYLQNHVLYHTVSDELRERVADSHLRLLDSSRSLFLEKEAAELRRKTGELFPALSLDECGILESMHLASIERYREMEDFVRRFVSDDDYAIDEQAELVLDPEKRGFPKNKSERRALYERLPHFPKSH